MSIPSLRPCMCASAALLECQLSTKDKTGLGYGDQLSKSNSEVPTSVFDSRSSDGDDIQANDRFKKVDGYHIVPPSLIGNYIPLKADLSFDGLNDPVYKYKVSESIASESKVETNNSKTSNEKVDMPKIETVRMSEPIIEE
ncbi:hypothetical protein Tco_1252572 [Tanacetum coccineum]